MARRLPDLSKHRRPAPITKAELAEKLGHLRAVLEAHKKSGILLTAEGAMRWLTGIRHQIIDIAPDADSPVQALIVLRPSGYAITFVTTRIEMPRVKDQIPDVFKGMRGVAVSFAESLQAAQKGLCKPADKTYPEILGAIVRPLLGGTKGNSFKKLDWLASMTSALLAFTAHEIQPGMHGAQVRGLLFKNFADWAVESNLFLVCLKGQEGHFHPLYDERYTVKEKSWMKLVAGARYADQIVSETVMVNIGGRPTAKQAKAYATLQEGVVEYADCYRAGRTEDEIYADVVKRFRRLEKESGLKGFAKSATFHHMGGPTSPVGNRDYILEKGGTERMFAGMQFAINPVETIGLTKVETQGIVQAEGAPLMVDMSRFTPSNLMAYREVTASGGTVAKINELILRD